MGVAWLGSGDTLDAAPTVEATSNSGITVENITLGGASNTIKNQDGKYRVFATSTWFQFDLTMPSSISGKHWVDFDITTTNGEKRIGRICLDVGPDEVN